MAYLGKLLAKVTSSQLASVLLEYACSAWNPCTKKNEMDQQDKIEMDQRWATTLFYTHDYLELATPVIDHLCWDSLKQRR